MDKVVSDVSCVEDKAEEEESTTTSFPNNCPQLLQLELKKKLFAHFILVLSFFMLRRFSFQSVSNSIVK